jgi:hypothetical protein
MIDDDAHKKFTNDCSAHILKARRRVLPCLQENIDFKVSMRTMLEQPQFTSCGNGAPESRSSGVLDHAGANCSAENPLLREIQG